MPVLPRLLIFLNLIVLAGCVSNRPPLPEDSSRDREVADADSIEIVVGSSSGIYGGPSSSERWLLRRNGECKGTVSVGTNAGTSTDKVEELTLHSEEKYRECQQLLRETRFFWMRDREPKIRFENSTDWIEVRAGHRHHSVQIVSPETPPTGFSQITDFVHGLQEQAKEVKK